MRKSPKVNPIKEYFVQCENKKLVDIIEANLNTDLKKYKEKLTTEIGEYLKLREHIQKFKTMKDDGSLVCSGVRTERSRKKKKDKGNSKDQEKWEVFDKPIER